MSQTTQIKLLKLSMQVVGVIFIVGIYALMVLWPSGWRWHTGHSHYPAMILGVYATLGLFLLLASRNPLAHLSLIWFTVWSSVVHGLIMAVQSLQMPEHMGHLYGDVPALILGAIVLGALAWSPARSPQVAS